MSTHPEIPLSALAAKLGLSRVWSLEPEVLEAAMKRGQQPIAPLPAGYGPTTEPALSFKVR